MSGKAAAFGGRMMNSVADQILKQFAANFAREVAALAAQRSPASSPGDCGARRGAGAARPPPARRAQRPGAGVGRGQGLAAQRLFAEGGVNAPAQRSEEIADLQQELRAAGYIAERPLAAALLLMADLQRPLLLEGDAGVGKTEVAKALAAVRGARLIRLQCYEGLDVHAAMYEWNYQRQLLAIKLLEHDERSVELKEQDIFSERYLLRRPLLEAISCAEPPVLLIDEVDRADEAFEAYLLELLSDFQMSIPELGTVRAVTRPLVVITSNGTRELSDALRRRCLYQYIDYPAFEKELAIVEIRAPEASAELARQLVEFVQSVRRMDLQKKPGIAETLDWTAALLRLGISTIDEQGAERILETLERARQDPRRPRRIHARGRRPDRRRMLIVAPTATDRPGPLLRTRLTGFAGFLRANGYGVGGGDAAEVLATASEVGFVDRDILRWSLKALLCGRSDEWRRFDALFDATSCPATSVRCRQAICRPARRPGRRVRRARRRPRRRVRARPGRRARTKTLPEGTGRVATNCLPRRIFATSTAPTRCARSRR